MKTFGAWLLVTLATFGIGSAAYHAWLEASPRMLLVVVDSAHDMRHALPRVREQLQALAATRYARFALYTEKSRLHGWSDRLDPGRLRAYGPRDPQRLLAGDLGPEFAEADEVLLFSNAEPASLGTLPEGWRLLAPR